MIEIIDNRDNRHSKFGDLNAGTMFTMDSGLFYVKATNGKQHYGMNIENGILVQFKEDVEIEIVHGTLEVE